MRLSSRSEKNQYFFDLYSFVYSIDFFEYTVLTALPFRQGRFCGWGAVHSLQHQERCACRKRSHGLTHQPMRKGVDCSILLEKTPPAPHLAPALRFSLTADTVVILRCLTYRSTHLWGAPDTADKLCTVAPGSSSVSKRLGELWRFREIPAVELL